MFESEFLIPAQESKDRYQQLISQAAQIVCTSLPAGPYNGKNGTELATLVSPDFLPAAACPPEQIAAILRVVVSKTSLFHQLGAHGRQLRLLPRIESADDVDYVLEPGALQQAGGDHAAVSALAVNCERRIMIHLWR